MPRISEFLELVRSGVPAHATISADPLTRLRHESFILRNLVVGVLSIAAIPVYLAFIDGASPAGIVALGLLSLLAPVALHVSRTGHLNSAHVFQAVVIAAFVTWLMLLSGGTGSAAVFWLAILPFEAAITGSRRLVLVNVLISAAVFCGMAAAQAFGMAEAAMISDPAGEKLAGLLSAALVLYGFLLVLEFDGVSRQTEDQARDRAFLSTTIGESVIDAVSLHDQQGGILFVTPSVADLLKVDWHDVLGNGLFARVHVGDRPAYLKALSDAIAEQKSTSVEFRARRSVAAAEAESDAAQEFIWLEMRCKPLEARSDRPDRLVAVTRDITERRLYEEELRLQRQKAEEASELKTRFLANVSHELRTPLNAIIGFSDLISSQPFGPIENEKYLEYVHLIHGSGEHLLNVVNDILDMSKIEAGKFQVIPEPFEIAPLISECVDMLMPQALEARVSILPSVEPGVKDVMADRRAVRQIVLNLLSNAIKFTEVDGKITISARTSGTRFVLSVSDTGIGVPAEDLEHLGKPFYQVDNAYSRQKEGTGLGLSVVRGLTELHGGDMKIKSELGIGTTVAIEFPHEEAAAPIKLHAPAQTAGPVEADDDGEPVQQRAASL